MKKKYNNITIPDYLAPTHAWIYNLEGSVEVGYNSYVMNPHPNPIEGKKAFTIKLGLESTATFHKIIKTIQNTYYESYFNVEIIKNDILIKNTNGELLYCLRNVVEDILPRYISIDPSFDIDMKEDIDIWEKQTHNMILEMNAGWFNGIDIVVKLSKAGKEYDWEDDGVYGNGKYMTHIRSNGTINEISYSEYILTTNEEIQKQIEKEREEREEYERIEKEKTSKYIKEITDAITNNSIRKISEYDNDFDRRRPNTNSHTKTFNINGHTVIITKDITKKIRRGEVIITNTYITESEHPINNETLQYIYNLK